MPPPEIGTRLPALDWHADEGPVTLAGTPAVLYFFKSTCPTCALAFPYLDRLDRAFSDDAVAIWGVSQESPATAREFEARCGVALPCLDDSDLTTSNALGIDYVPTVLVLDAEGTVRDVAIGHDKAAWNRMAATLREWTGREVGPVAPADDGQPDFQPACTSLSFDLKGEAPPPRPAFTARRIVVPATDDPVEYCYYAGYTDGMPVVPPTEARVERMLAGVDRDPQEVVGEVAPNYGRATVEKIAINGVMAGCLPEYMPVLIAGVKAMCREEFNLHGIQATTHSASSLFLINGPIAERLDINGGLNAFGQGWRANATIGRALKLIMQNVGGCRPGEIDRSTQGNPGKFSFCLAENEALSPWEPYHVEHGFGREDSTITLFAAESPQNWSDHGSRTAEQVVACMGHTLATAWNHKGYPTFDMFIALCPEHARIIARDGWSKADIKAWLQQNIRRPLREVLPGPDGGESIAAAIFGAEPAADMLDTPVPKFMTEDAIHIFVAGGDGGMFSSYIPGWVGGATGSIVVTERIEDPAA